MEVNKVELADGSTLIDLSGDTLVDESQIADGVTGHLADGRSVTGTMTPGYGYMDDAIFNSLEVNQTDDIVENFGSIVVSRDMSEVNVEGTSTGIRIDRTGMASLDDRSVAFGVGTGGNNAGFWDADAGRWVIYTRPGSDVTYGLSHAFLTDNVTVFSSQSIAASGNSSGTVSVAKSGYTPIGIVGWNMSTVKASITRFYLNGSTLNYIVTNSTTSKINSVTLTARILYVAT